MKAEDLRIGNLVKDQYAGIHKIKSINKYYVETESDGKDNLTNHKQAIKWLKPIPLTPEELVKLGFTKSVNVGAFKDLKARMSLHFYGVPSELDIAQDGKHISFARNHIKHVHQLQNLYFALTGEELTYTT